MATTRPDALILDDGELQDVRNILDQLGALYATEGDEAALLEVPLLVTSLGRARQIHAKGSPLPKHVLHLVVANADDRDLGAALRGAVCDFIVRRPVDASVLALVTRRAGYRGPERRRVLRVGIGTPVRVSLEGCRGTEDVILAQLSIAGCGLISRDPLPRVELSVQFPAELTAPRGLSLDGRVLHTREVATADGLVYDSSVAFDEVRLGDRVTLRAVMAGQPIDFRPEAISGSSPRQLAADAGDDRREVRRRAFAHRTLAGVERRGFTRVLIGRDISLAGMRVEREPDLGLGDAVHLALYSSNREEPIVIDATVQRDDEEEGWYLGFDASNQGTRSQLVRLIEDLEDERESDGQPTWVVSEVAERA